MFTSLQPHHRRLYAAYLLNFVLFGVTLTLIGATLPKVIRTFGWDYTVSGVVLASGAVGYFCATFVAGFLIRRVGPRPVIVVGLCLEGLGLLLFARHPSPYVNLALNVLIGVGHGCTEVIVNYGTIQIEPRGESRLMNFLHAVFCVGAVLGPLVVGGVIRVTARWRLVYPAVGVLVIGMAVLLAFMRFPDPKRTDGAGADRGSKANLVSPLLVVFAIMLFLYVSAEIGASNWIAELFVREIQVSASMGAVMVSLMWLGVFAGRMGLAIWFRGDRQALVIPIISTLSAVSFAGMLMTRSPAVAAICVVAAGLGFSGVYPMVITLVGRHCPGGAAVGIVSTGGGIGSFALPFLIGFVGDRVGLRGGFALCIGACLILAALAALITRNDGDGVGA